MNYEAHTGLGRQRPEGKGIKSIAELSGFMPEASGRPEPQGLTWLGIQEPNTILPIGLNYEFCLLEVETDLQKTKPICLNKNSKQFLVATTTV